MLFCGLTAKLEMQIQAVLEAIMALFIICGTLLFVVWRCKDFVGFHRAVFRGLIWAVLIHLALVFIAIFSGHFSGAKDQWFGLLFSVSMIIVGCFYLCFDLLLIIIPNLMDKDEYILAAMMLYLDVA